jgi:putative transposase
MRGAPGRRRHAHNVTSLCASAIRAAHAGPKGTYGAPRIIEDLWDVAHRLGRNRVARLMRLDGLSGVSKRRGPARPRRTAPEATASARR